MGIWNRRQLLTSLGYGGALLLTEKHLPAFEDRNYIQDQLETIGKSADAIAVRKALAQSALDSTWANLASTFLQNNESSLTGFQQDLLKAVATATRDPQALSALIEGNALTLHQIFSLQCIKDDLRNNPAIREIYRTAEELRENRSQLTTYVQQVVGGNSQSLPTPTGLGMPMLDAVISDFSTVRQSSSFANLANALAKVFDEPDFVRYFAEQPSQVIASFIPIDTVLALMLPSDKDPLLTPVQKGTLEIIGGYIAIIVGFLSIPIDLAVAGVAIGVLTIAGGMIALVLGFDDLYSAIDCDFDGDPSDPADVPGQECPAN